MNIAIMESLGVGEDELKKLEAPFIDKGCVFSQYQRTSDAAKLAGELKDVDAAIIANMPFGNDVLRSANKLRFLDVAFTGVDHVGLDAAREKGIAVSNAAGYSNEAVAELALGMTIALYRRLPEAGKRARNGGTKDGLRGKEIKGRTVGIIGTGKIGSLTADLFHALGASVLANNRTIHKGAPSWLNQVSFDELMAHSDIVILHCPLNDASRGMINKEKLALMKKSALLINVARGPIVVAKDLADALNQGLIAGAASDVFDAEPPLPAAEPLLKAKNMILTPHLGFATEEAMTLRAGIVFDNLKAWMEGKQQNKIL
jgi:D-3-phosphoglycerate dehydrogenase